MRLAMISAAALAMAIAPQVAAAERRPTAISMGVSASAEEGPFHGTILGLPVTIDVGTLVEGELWWHGSASFGATEVRDEVDAVEGHDFDLRTGPRVTHCWDRYCVSAGIELGWGHSRWGFRGNSVTYDDVQLEGRVRASVALSPSGLVQLEASAGPRLRYYLRAAGDMQDVPVDPVLDSLTRGLAAGLALVVRN